MTGSVVTAASLQPLSYFFFISSGCKWRVQKSWNWEKKNFFVVAQVTSTKSDFTGLSWSVDKGAQLASYTWHVTAIQHCVGSYILLCAALSISRVSTRPDLQGPHEASWQVTQSSTSFTGHQGWLPSDCSINCWIIGWVLSLNFTVDIGQLCSIHCSHEALCLFSVILRMHSFWSLFFFCFNYRMSKHKAWNHIIGQVLHRVGTTSWFCVLFSSTLKLMYALLCHDLALTNLIQKHTKDCCFCCEKLWKS